MSTGAELAREWAKSASLKTELATLQREYDHLLEQMESVIAHLKVAKKRLAEDSYNNSKPPSSDGLARKSYLRRQAVTQRLGSLTDYIPYNNSNDEYEVKHDK